jgi:hypothetical protein
MSPFQHKNLSIKVSNMGIDYVEGRAIDCEISTKMKRLSFFHQYQFLLFTGRGLELMMVERGKLSSYWVAIGVRIGKSASVPRELRKRLNHE